MRAVTPTRARRARPSLVQDVVLDLMLLGAPQLLHAIEICSRADAGKSATRSRNKNRRLLCALKHPNSLEIRRLAFLATSIFWKLPLARVQDEAFGLFSCSLAFKVHLRAFYGNLRFWGLAFQVAALGLQASGGWGAVPHKGHQMPPDAALATF